MTTPTRLFAALIALALLWLPMTGAAAQEDAGYTAIITEETVDVRSGAGRAYYVVGELEVGQRVRVVEVLFDETWYKISVPDGVYSYVSTAFVNAQGDGSIGVVNADRTEFKAASLRGPGESYRVQGTFGQGDRVEIVAQEGSFYKIIAPVDAYVFVPAGSLRRATADDMVPAETDEPTTDETDEPTEPDTPQATDEPADDQTPDAVEDIDEPAEPVDQAEDTPEDGTDEVVPDGPAVDENPADTETPADTVDPTPTDDAATDGTTDEAEANPDVAAETDDGSGLPALPDVEVSTPARSDALIAKEMELLPYFSSPIEERPLDHMEAQYTELLEQGDLPRVDQQIIGVRLRTIARQREILAAMQRVEAAQSEREPRTVIPDIESLPRTPVEYQAIGLLQVSSVYDGQSLPRMYRLVDPSGRTVAYVAPTPMIDESDLLDTLVGVVGTSSYDPALKLQIITPEQLDALAAED